MSGLRRRSRAQVRVHSTGVRLLLDQNLAPRLVTTLATLYPESKHVRELGLATACRRVALCSRGRLHHRVKGRRAHAAVIQFEADPEASFLALG